MPAYGTEKSRLAVILLAEDDPGDQELTRRALEEDVVRVDLRIVSDGEEALDYLHQRGAYADPQAARVPT
jgi:CheY-like chemotaxis protein